MPYSPILMGHICAGTLGLLSGTAAMSFRKGSPRHVLAGRVFVASMLTMAVAAVYLGSLRHQPNNIGGGILLLSDRNCMADCQAQRWENRSLRLGCALDSFSARYRHLDERYKSRA